MKERSVCWYRVMWLQKDRHSPGRHMFPWKAKAAFEMKILIFRIFHVSEDHNAQAVAQQNKIPQGKWNRQIVNNFQYLPYISKELLICLCYCYIWKVLWTCWGLAISICVHTDVFTLSPTEHSLPPGSLPTGVGLGRGDSLNGMQPKMRQVA